MVSFLLFCINPVKAQSHLMDSNGIDKRFKINEKEILPLSLKNEASFDIIPELKTKKIVMIGETIHGTETMHKVGFQLIRRLIEKNNCRLVLLELALEQMLSFNRFVQGDDSFDIDSIMYSFNIELITTRQLKEFCLWLREYNKNTNEKVWFLGANYCLSPVEFIHFNDYLYNVNITKKNTVIKKLYMDVRDEVFRGDYTKAINTVKESYISLEEAVGEMEAAMILQCITMLDNMLKVNANDFLQAQIVRDSVMFLNTDFLINLLKPEKTAIFLHWGHVNYVEGGFPVGKLKPFGKYMKQKYGDDLFCTSIRTANGSYLTAFRDSTNNNFYFTVKQLDAPQTGSLEYFLSKTKKDYFFAPSALFPMSFLPVRSLGNQIADKQYLDFPLIGDDGILFIRQCEPLDYPQEKLIQPINPKTDLLVAKHLKIDVDN